MCSILGLWYCTPAIVQDKLRGIQRRSLLSSRWLERSRRENGSAETREWKTRLHLDIMFINCMRTILGNITGCYNWSPMVNWLHDVLSVPCCQLHSFWRPADVKRKHIRLPCWIHYSNPSINIVLLLVPGELLPPAHQLWLSQPCHRVCVGLSRKRRASAVRFRSKFLWTLRVLWILTSALCGTRECERTFNQEIQTEPSCMRCWLSDWECRANR